MRFRYQVYKAHGPENEAGITETFGIRCYVKRNDSWLFVCEVDDISPEKSLVTALAENCNAVQLDPEHLWDVACDVQP